MLLIIREFLIGESLINVNDAMINTLLFPDLLSDSSYFFFKFIPVSICFDPHF